MLAMLPDDADMAYRLIELRQCIDSPELSFAQLAADFKEGKHWEHLGANSAIDWIHFNCNMTSNAVADRIAVGEQSGHLPESILSMKADHIGFAHLTVMARTAAAVGDVFDEKHLLELAENSSPGKFHYRCLHYRHAVNAEKYAADQERLTEGRSLRLNATEDGCLLISGILDPVGGAAVRAALEPLGRPSGAHDHRRRDQRMADAFVELAMGRKPASLQITASIETLKSIAGAAGGEMEFSLPISSATVQRIACDCSVTRILLDQESMVIDVGRSRRIVTGALRKALELRDKHCQWPGCERPGSWCEGHHFHHWIHGGRTDLDNCVLICKRHHRMVHEGRWQLIRVEGRTVTVAPTFRFAPARGPD